VRIMPVLRDEEDESMAVVTIRLNGEIHEVESGARLIALLEQLQIHPDGVVVEKNRRIVPRESFSDEALQQGDEVELIRFVGGG